MKRLILMSLIFTSSCMSDDGKPLSGEHLNGLKYQVYSGPAEVQEAYLDRIVTALVAYAKESSDAVLKKTLDQSREKSWSRVEFEHLPPETKKSAAPEIRIGVRYEKGPLQCVVFQNQAMAAFSVKEGERQSEKIYYVSGEKELRVTHAYSF